jgi:hypothetical protein
MRQHTLDPPRGRRAGRELGGRDDPELQRLLRLVVRRLQIVWERPEVVQFVSGRLGPNLARQLREAGWIQGGERVVVLNTGAGIKYPDAITVVPK